MKIYPASQFTKNNTSLTTDGSFIYLLVGQEKRGNMYKIGTGMGATVAGRVYLNVRSRKEGNVTWAYCQGKLYLRRVGEPHGLVTIIDPMDFRTQGELTLDLEERFKDNK